jgi:hypothetical protein
MHTSNRVFAAVVCAAGLIGAASARGASYTNDFSSGLGGITTTTDSVGFGPDINAGSLRLTQAVNSLQNSAILPDLNPGGTIRSFQAWFDLAIGPGTPQPADGLSFVFGQLNGTENFGEEGPGGFNGLTVSFDTYDNGVGVPEAPAIDVKLNDAVVAGGHSTRNPYTNGLFVPVLATLDPDGTLDLSVDGTPVFTNLATGFAPQPGDRFGFGARTGGSNAEHRIDNLSITTVVPEPSAAAVAGFAGLFALRRQRRS